MIILGRNLVLVPSGSPSWLNADSPIIGWHNLVTAGFVVGSSEDVDYPAINLANPATHLKWRATSSADQTLTFTPSSVVPENIDYVAIVRHNLATAESQISIRQDSVDLIDPVILPADEVTIFRLPTTAFSEIEFLMENNTSAPEIAVVYIGRLLYLQRRIYVGHTPIVDGKQSIVANPRSESGNFLGRIILSETYDTTFNMNNVEAAWYREYMRPFVEASTRAPFFFGWRPGTYPREAGYVWTTRAPRPVNQLNNGMMQVQIPVSGVVL